jgi:hypothetical protein
VVSGQSSADFGPAGLASGSIPPPSHTVFGFGDPKLTGFSFGFRFSPMDGQWWSEIENFK